MNAVLKEDFEILSQKVNFGYFRNSVFLVTGATGLIGSLVVKSLLYAQKKDNLGIKVFAVVRNLEKAKKIYECFADEPALSFVRADLTEEQPQIGVPVHYIIHAAAVTVSKLMVSDPVGNIKTALQGTQNMLEFARVNGVKGMAYVSSMEVYGKVDGEEKTDENALGFIDLSSARSCYPEGKRMCECMCNAYFHEFGVPVKTARLAQTFGAGVLHGDNRVFAQFAESAMNGKDIVLHTDGSSHGNYVYTRDAVSALFTLLEKGESGQAYNVCNEESHTTIAGMAKMVCEKVADGKIKVVFDIPESNKYGYAPPTKLFLSSQKLNRLGWKAEVGLAESYERLIAYLKDDG